MSAKHRSLILPRIAALLTLLRLANWLNNLQASRGGHNCLSGGSGP